MAEYNVGTVEITLATKMDEASKKASSVILQLNKLKGGVKDTKRQIDLTADSSKRLGNNLKKAFDVGKAYVAFNYIKRYSKVLTKAFKYSIDYTETLNKFEVSMDRMFDKAVRFQNKLNEAFGLSKSELMDYQANFNNIVKAMGDIDEEMAYSLSEKLTEMSLDFASLFNTTTEEAMSKFQAALTQQVRPIRSVSGFDITQATMGGVLKQIGIEDRTVQQLSQVEKRLLTIITLQRQMEAIGASGDFANTFTQPANQLKVMQQVLKDLGIAFGNFVMYSLAPTFSYVNGFLMAIKEIFEFLYTLLPKRGGDSKVGSLNDVLQPEKAASGVKDTKKAIKELKNAMGSIDELNVISPPSDTSGGDVGGVGGFGGVDPRLLEAMKDYDNQIEKVKNNATKVRDRIMEWLGFTKLVDEKTGEVTFKLKDGITKFEIIKGLLKTISVLTITAFTGKGVTNLLNSLGKTPSDGLRGALNGVALGAGGIILGFDGFNKIIDGDTKNNIEGLVELLGGGIGLAFSINKVTKALGSNSIAGSLIGSLGGLVLGVGSTMLVIDSFNKLLDGDTTNNVEGIIELILGGSGVVFAIAKATSSVSQLMELLSPSFTFIINDLKNLIGLPTEKGTLIGAFASLGIMVFGCYEIFQSFNKLLDDDTSNDIQGIIELIIGSAGLVVGFKALQAVFKGEKGINSLLSLSNLKFVAVAAAVAAVVGVSAVLVSHWDKLSNSQKVVASLGAIAAAAGAAAIAWATLSASASAAQSAITLGVGAAAIVAGITAVSIAIKRSTRDAKEAVKQYATGGFPTRGDYFLANENGVPEYVGSMGGKTAVANTNQIVDGISIGVYKANAEQNRLLQEQNAYLRQIASKDLSVNLDGRKVSNQIKKSDDGRGFNSFVGGFAYG